MHCRSTHRHFVHRHNLQLFVEPQLCDEPGGVPWPRIVFNHCLLECSSTVGKHVLINKAHHQQQADLHVRACKHECNWTSAHTFNAYIGVSLHSRQVNTMSDLGHFAGKVSGRPHTVMLAPSTSIVRQGVPFPMMFGTSFDFASPPSFLTSILKCRNTRHQTKGVCGIRMCRSGECSSGERPGRAIRQSYVVQVLPGSLRPNVPIDLS